jgi:hypothetical protein
MGAGMEDLDSIHLSLSDDAEARDGDTGVTPVLRRYSFGLWLVNTWHGSTETPRGSRQVSTQPVESVEACHVNIWCRVAHMAC